jgi:hypothetical protein
MSVKVLENLELLKSWVKLENWEDSVIENLESTEWDGINEWTKLWWNGA